MHCHDFSTIAEFSVIGCSEHEPCKLQFADLYYAKQATYNKLIPNFKLAESCRAKEPITLRLRGRRVA